MNIEGAVDKIADDAKPHRSEGERNQLFFDRDAKKPDPRRCRRRATGDPNEIKSGRMHFDIGNDRGSSGPIPDGHLASIVFLASSPMPAMVLARLESSSGISTSFEFGEATTFPMAVT